PWPPLPPRTPASPPSGPRGGPPIIEPATPAPAASISNNSLTRYAQYEQLKRALEAAKQQGSKPDAAKVFLGKVLKGEIALRIEAHREDDVRNALHLADELKLRIVLDGLTNPRAAAETIMARRLPLVLGPFLEMEEVPGYRRGRPADWPKALLAPDARWALGTFSTHGRGSRLLRAHAAAAVAR